MIFTEELTASKIAALSPEDKAAYLKWEAAQLTLVSAVKKLTAGKSRSTSSFDTLQGIAQEDVKLEFEFNGKGFLRKGRENPEDSDLLVGIIAANKNLFIKASQEVWDEEGRVGILALKGLKGTVDILAFNDDSGRVYANGNSMAFS